MLVFSGVHGVGLTLQIFQGLLDLIEVVGILDAVNRTTQVLDLNQVLLDLGILVIPFNVINRIFQVFQICHILIWKNVAMRAGLNVKEWSGEIPQGDNLLLNFIKLMVEFHSLSHWVGHLLERVQLTSKIGEMMFTFYFVNWVVQLPKVCHVLLNLRNVYREGQHDKNKKHRHRRNVTI